jgi:DNA-binding CsgD family transcriptional regulator
VTITREQVEALLQLARDATAGRTFEARMGVLADHLTRLVPCTSLSMLLQPLDGGSPAPDHHVLRALDPGALAQYAAHYVHVDPMQVGQRMRRHLGQVVTLSDCAPGRAYGRDEFTGEFLPRHGLRHIVGVAMPMPGDVALAVALHREARLGDFTAAERRVMHLVQADLARAAFAALVREKVARLAAGGAGGDAGCLVFDARGDVLRGDPAALALCAREGFPWDALLAEVRRAGRDPALVVYRLADGARVLARLSAEGGRVVAELQVERRAPGAGLSGLALRHRLTAREVQVAALVVDGHTNRQLAQALGISPATAAVHVRRILRKTGVRGRAGLLRLALER